MRTTPLLLAATALAFSACETETAGVTADFNSLYDHFLSRCANCHAPGAPGFKEGTEKTLNFSTADTAAKALREGRASGLGGNQEGCNGVAFVVPGKPGSSLVAAALDESVRTAFDDPTHPDCDGTAISAMGVQKVGEDPSADFLVALEQWISDGAN